MSAPLVSTIIPVYNGEAFLGAALESALEQDYEPQEVIVVDDGSTDGTAEVASRFPAARYIHQENGGPPVARNSGISIAAGEFICLLDADDLMAPGRLRRQVGYLLEHPTVGAVVGRQELLIEPGVELPAWAQRNVLRSPSGDTSAHTGQDHFPLPTLTARRSVFREVGLFNPGLRRGDDTGRGERVKAWNSHSSDIDWLFRVKEAGIRVAGLDEVFIRRRFHGANLTYDREGVRDAIFLAFKARIDRRRASRTNPGRET